MCSLEENENGWPALAGPGLAGDCWFVVPVRFFDWARGLDGVYLLTRRELYAPQPRPLCYRFRLVTVVVVTKSRSPKVGSPTLGSVVVRRTAGAGYPGKGQWRRAEDPGPCCSPIRARSRGNFLGDFLARRHVECHNIT